MVRTKKWLNLLGRVFATCSHCHTVFIGNDCVEVGMADMDGSFAHLIGSWNNSKLLATVSIINCL